MPTRPPVHRPVPRRTRKAYEQRRTAGQRITGRTLQRRNQRIALRDGYTCQCCGRVTTDGEVDHRVPLAEGGTEDDGNLQWLCRVPCHREKSRREAARGRQV